MPRIYHGLIVSILLFLVGTNYLWMRHSVQRGRNDAIPTVGDGAGLDGTVALRPDVAYRPRQVVMDPGGFGLVQFAVPRWKADATLEDLAGRWHHAGQRGIKAIDEKLKDPRLSVRDELLLRCAQGQPVELRRRSRVGLSAADAASVEGRAGQRSGADVDGDDCLSSGHHGGCDWGRTRTA